MAGVNKVTPCRRAFNESADINTSKERRWRESTIEIVNINIKKTIINIYRLSPLGKHQNTNAF